MYEHSIGSRSNVWGGLGRRRVKLSRESRRRSQFWATQIDGKEATKSPRKRNELIPRVEVIVFLALDQFRINSGGLRCELRAWYVGSIKVVRRRYAYYSTRTTAVSPSE